MEVGILQDNKEDWEEAATTMADVYENAYITIAATFAQTSNGGLFSSARPVTRRLDRHPHLFIREIPPFFPSGFFSGDTTSWPLLTRAWVYQERRLSARTIHFGKYQVYFECQSHFASEDASEDKAWRQDADHIQDPYDLQWGDKVVDSAKNWQKILREYTPLGLSYESDRLPAIAALVDRMSMLRRADDVYIAGMWKNTMLSDILWIADSNQPRPARLVPSWSWASTQNAGVTWYAGTLLDTSKVVNLEYTALGSAHLGDVSNASIVLRISVLNLTDAKTLSPFDVRDLNHHRSLKGILRSTDLFKWKSLRSFHPVFYADYDLATNNAAYSPRCVLKLLVSKDASGDLGGPIIRQVAKNPAEYQRIGFLRIHTRISRYPNPEVTGGYAEDKEVQVDDWIRSLPMEELKII
jgi:hypothetical protein